MKLVILLTFLLAISAAPTPKHRQSLQNFREAMLLLQSGYQVDSVVSMLQALYSVQNDNLQALFDNWAASSADLQSAIDAQRAIVDERSRDCVSITTNIGSAQRSHDIYLSHIEEAQTTIASNLDSLEAREKARCEANLIFIDRVLEARRSLGFLKFLQGKLNDPAFRSYLNTQLSSLAQVKLSSSNIISFLAKHHFKALIQNKQLENLDAYELIALQDVSEAEDEGAYVPDLDQTVQERSDIGTGHIDNNKGELHLDKYVKSGDFDADTFIAQANEIISQLIDSLRADIETLLDNEDRFNQNFIEYKEQLIRENGVLQKYIEIWSHEVKDSEVTLELFQSALEECFEKVAELEADAAAKEEEFANLEKNYKTSRSSITNTISLLEEVIDTYITKVAKAPAVYKQRVEDYLSSHRAVEPQPPAVEESSDNEGHAAPQVEESSEEEVAEESSEEEPAEESSEEEVAEESSEEEVAEESSEEEAAEESSEEEVAEESSEENVEESSEEEVEADEDEEETAVEDDEEVAEESSESEEEVEEEEEEFEEEEEEAVVEDEVVESDDEDVEDAPLPAQDPSGTPAEAAEPQAAEAPAMMFVHVPGKESRGFLNN